LTGAGTVVTGTSLWGELEVGSDVRIFPHDTAARVRRLHVHGDERSVVGAGRGLLSISQDSRVRPSAVVTRSLLRGRGRSPNWSPSVSSF